MSDRMCKCGIKVYEGVVPFELGFSYYCDYSYGDFWRRRNLPVPLPSKKTHERVLYFAELR